MLAGRYRPIVLGAVLSLGALPGSPSAAAEVEPCRQDSRYAVLAPWVGEWRIVDAAGKPLGVSTVRSILAGCAVEEVRRRTDGSEESEEVGLTYLDLASDTWRQRWVSSRGDTGLLELLFEDGGVRVQGSVHMADGGEALVRSKIAPRPEGGFLETLELSTDGGTVYAAGISTLYLPRDEALRAPTPPGAGAERPAPAPKAASVTEAPEPASMPSAGVKVRSKRKAKAPVPETAMESPMTLEFELGPLADLPPGSAWRTTELAPYVADEVNITRVTAQTRERKGKTELELVVSLRTRVGQSKVDLDVALLAGEASVASERIEGITLGKLIRAHDSQDGFPQTVRLAVDSTAFAALFADDNRPAVRLTVTVR